MRRPATLLAAAALLTLCAGAFFGGTRGEAAAPRVTLVPQAYEVGLRATAGPPTTAQCRAQSSGRYACYQPSQLRVAYGLNALYRAGLKGQGQTIVIVDAFGSPTIARDLAAFDAAFGIPAPPSFKVIHPAGAIPPYSPSGADRVGWASETSLDVEWAHALAPKANILLVETPTDEVEGTSGFPDIVKAENYVISHHLGSVISQSFGATEQTFTGVSQLNPLRSAYVAASKAHVSVVSGSGDLGATDYKMNAKDVYTYRVSSWPASDPLVTAVGGTKLNLDGTGHRLSPDVAWNDHTSPPGRTPEATGGGVSIFFNRPSYQAAVASVTGAKRGIPDVSLSSACTGLVDVYMSFPGVPAGWHPMCGTSEATPLFAAVVALAAQKAGHGLGLLNPALYALAASKSPGIVDVTSGDNTAVWRDASGTTRTVTGYRAVAGFDLATGVGTIDAAKLVPALAARLR